jgi:rSAM/selenodomain-associated transferase 1
MSLAVQVLVLAKAPVAGRVKTRLCPPLTPQEAAEVAAASLQDTLDAVRAADVAERVLVVDGPLRADGFAVRPQVAGGLDARLGAAFDEAAGRGLPALLVGMDTPQLTPALLEQAARALLHADAVLGLAPDGGWWALGLRAPTGALLRGIPTSREDTGRQQLGRLREAGLAVAALPLLRDVDTASDARAVAALAPGGRFAAIVHVLLGGVAAA